MTYAIIALLMTAGFIAMGAMEANAVVCARGVYRAGCVGTVGVHPVVVRRTVAVRPVVHRRVIY
jgi:hypothetical protein